MSKLTGLGSVSLCMPGGVRLSGTGVSGATAARPATLATREASVSERPTQAPTAAVVAAAPSGAYVPVTNVAGAGHQIFGQQKTQLHTMWALRGLNPRSDPA
ncbi:hypothetical protein OIE51_18725 [Streptomyces sp. NBC_01803]|nr:hypothetical protein OIE51_18725 [Streptomyces sp. NBC_01803]